MPTQLNLFFVGDNMARDFAGNFYKRQEWKNCRSSYLASVGGLCERCLSVGEYRPAEIVHHTIYLDESNINNPSYTLNWNNLEALCRECHAKEHELGKGRAKRRYRVSDDGSIAMRMEQ